jgi:hypothetical protein
MEVRKAVVLEDLVTLFGPKVRLQEKLNFWMIRRGARGGGWSGKGGVNPHSAKPRINLNACSTISVDKQQSCTESGAFRINVRYWKDACW